MSIFGDDYLSLKMVTINYYKPTRIDFRLKNRFSDINLLQIILAYPLLAAYNKAPHLLERALS